MPFSELKNKFRFYLSSKKSIKTLVFLFSFLTILSSVHMKSHEENGFTFSYNRISSGIAQSAEHSTLMRKYPRSITGRGRIKKYSIFYWEYFWAVANQVRIEHDLPLPMIRMVEPLANYVNLAIRVQIF